MQRATRYLSGVLIAGTVVSATAPLTTSAQGARPDACRYMDAAQMVQLTARKDTVGKGPQKADPAEIPRHTSGCWFLGVLLVLDDPFTAEQFTRGRAIIEKTTLSYKSQSLSGVGDDAYLMWDARPSRIVTVHLALRAGNKRISLEDYVPPDSVEIAKTYLIAFGKAAASRAKGAK